MFYWIIEIYFMFSFHYRQLTFLIFSCPHFLLTMRTETDSVVEKAKVRFERNWVFLLIVILFRNFLRRIRPTIYRYPNFTKASSLLFVLYLKLLSKTCLMLRLEIRRLLSLFKKVLYQFLTEFSEFHRPFK